MSDDVTPLGAIGRGLAAGFAGTAAMTASAPAQLARRVIEGVFQKQVPAARIGFLTEAPTPSWCRHRGRHRLPAVALRTALVPYIQVSETARRLPKDPASCGF
ncbi:MAG TPA: hypothetical protein VMS11_06970 [Solirubrobacterales bacterium]|nr:hypothetical protein [Solirubrobacterales bacterium]